MTAPATISSEPQPAIAVRNIVKRYGSFEAV